MIRRILENEDLKKDLHVHTRFCDGNGTPDEIVRAAIDRGLDVIGFSGHGYAPYDEEVCIPLDKLDAYEKEVREAAEKYADKITVLCGIEQDYYSDSPTDRWDYVIGSVHYLRFSSPKGNEYVEVDYTTDIYEKCIDRHFDGDAVAFAEKYYEVVSDVVLKTGADIIGHFDLIAMFNKCGENGGKGVYFDESDPRYTAAWKKAVDKLLLTDAFFEINYGGVTKGRRNEPYPSKPIIDYISSKGGRFVRSSDSHRPDTLACWENID